MMYATILVDRHTDPHVAVFNKFEDAAAYAREQAEEMGGNPKS